MTDLPFLTIAQASAQIKARTLSPVELTEAFLARVKQVDARLDSHLLVLEEQALAEAKKAESEITAGNWKGPLHGIPIGLKDKHRRHPYNRPFRAVQGPHPVRGCLHRNPVAPGGCRHHQQAGDLGICHWRIVV
jgi:hypothetical protein